MRKEFLWHACLVWCLVAGLRLAAQTGNSVEIQQHYKRAQEALQSRQDIVAERELREILRLDPRNAFAHLNLGVIDFTRKDFTQASQEFRAALKLQSSLWIAKAFLGMSELRLGNSQEARSLLENAFPHVQDSKLRTQVGTDLITLYHASNDLMHAVDVLRALGQSGADDPLALYLAYRTYSDLAAQQLAKLAQVAPESAQMHQILAQALASQDDFQGAIAQYRKALEVDPQLPGAHFEIGQLTLAESSAEPARQQAEKEFKSALAANPQDAECYYMLGEIEWLRSNPQGAWDDYKRALALRPTFVDAHIAAGKALATLGQPDQAIKHLEEAVHLDPQSEVAHYRLSEVYRKLGRTQDAQSELAAFRKLRDSHGPVRALYQQVQERSLRQQTVDPNEPQ